MGRREGARVFWIFLLDSKRAEAEVASEAEINY